MYWIILLIVLIFSLLVYYVFRKKSKLNHRDKVDLIVGKRDLNSAYSRLSAFHVDKDDSDN